jgi:hypothetical protein
MWFEELPDQCPPSDAKVPSNDRFYRLGGPASPSCDDFWSQHKQFPAKLFKSSDECKARAVSLFKDASSIERVRGMPLHKNKPIVEITLTSDSGVVQQTGGDMNHYSWWRLATFDPVKWTNIVTQNK